MSETAIEQQSTVESESPYASWVFGIGVVLFYAVAFFLPHVFHTGVLFRRATNVLACVAGAGLTIAERRCGNVWILFAVGFVQYLITVVIPDALDAGPLLVREFPVLRPVIVGACCAAGGFMVLVARGAVRKENLDPRVWLKFVSPFQTAFSKLERAQKIIQTITFFTTLLLALLGFLAR
jgi:hypothetical protein